MEQNWIAVAARFLRADKEPNLKTVSSRTWHISMPIKVISLLLLMTFSSFSSAARICNDMMFWIEYATSINYIQNDNIVIDSEGWHAIGPNDCETVTGGDYLYYVRSQETDEYLGRADWQWGGEYTMCTKLQSKDYSFRTVWPNGPLRFCSDIDDTSFVDAKDFGSSTTWRINSTTDVKLRGGYPKPIVTFGVSPTAVYTGDSLTFSWTSEYATTCSAGGDWSGSRALFSPSSPFGPLTSAGTKTYSLTCSNSTTSTTKSVNVSVSAGATLSQPRVIMQSPNEAYQAVRLIVDSATIDGVSRRDLVTWTSNIDGSLGQGGDITKNLSPGTHTITARINKNATVFVQKTISPAVTIVPSRPYLTVTAPASGRIFDLKEAIQFSASVRFAGANSTGANINWVSDRDGSIGTGYGFNNSNLTEGPHTITVTATQNGETDTKTVRLTIYDRQKNQGDKNDGNCFGGNPINLLTGNKYHEETDFSTTTESPLYLNRAYNSTSR